MAKAKDRKPENPTGNPIFEVGSTAEVADPIRCGVVGLGRIGWCHHSQAIMGHGGFSLVAVCDLEETRRAEARDASGCETYGRLSELLADDSVELVVVATQSCDHERMAIRALRAGKHVLVEKPATRTAAGVDRMMAAAASTGKVLTMHHNYRLNPEFLYVKETIDSGVLGRVFRIKRFVGGFSRRNDWQTLRKYGGGMVGNWGIHLVDHCLLLLDSPVKEIWGDVRHVFNPGDAEDDIKAVVQAESGMTLDIDMTSVNAAPLPSWAVMGTCGTLWIQGGKAHVKYFDGGALPPVTVNDLHYAIDRKYGVIPGPDVVPWQEREEEPKPKGTYESFYDNLHGAIREGRALLVDPRSARLTYDVLQRIRRGSGF